VNCWKDMANGMSTICFDTIAVPVAWSAMYNGRVVLDYLEFGYEGVVCGYAWDGRYDIIGRRALRAPVKASS
jgi:hypothetical protein